MLIRHPPVREYTPNVIEPSFGIGRILYSLLEHSYWARENDVARGVSDKGGLQNAAAHRTSITGLVSSTSRGSYQVPDCALECQL